MPSDDQFDAPAALEEAKARIASGATYLDLRIPHLKEIPKEIRNIQGLYGIQLEESSVSDLSPLSNMDFKSLDIDGTSVSNLEPISNCTKLENLYLSETAVTDISPLKNLRNMKTLFLRGLNISDISALSEMKYLESLSLARTNVSDLTPIAGMKNLQKISLWGSKVEDLTPLAEITSLSDGAVASENRGISFFHHTLPHPDTTVLCINKIRQSIGLPLYWPEDYAGSRDLADAPDFPLPEKTDLSDEALSQRAAPIQFQWTGTTIEAEVRRSSAFDSEAAEDIRQALKEKAAEALAMLSGNSADPRLIRSISELADRLNPEAAEARVGLLLMSLRSLQADAASYGASGSERERDMAAQVADIATSLEDLLSLYPLAREIEAQRQALNFAAQGEALAEFRRAVSQITDDAGRSPVTGASVVAALGAGSGEMDAISNDLQREADEVVSGQLIARRAEIAGYQALDVRNFVASAIMTARDELGGLGADSWREIRKSVPKGVGKGVEAAASSGVRVALAALISHFADPLLGLSTLIASFVPLSKAASTVSKALEEAEEKDAD